MEAYKSKTPNEILQEIEVSALEGSVYTSRWGTVQLSHLLRHGYIRLFRNGLQAICSITEKGKEHLKTLLIEN